MHLKTEKEKKEGKIGDRLLFPPLSLTYIYHPIHLLPKKKKKEAAAEEEQEQEQEVQY